MIKTSYFSSNFGDKLRLKPSPKEVNNCHNQYLPNEPLVIEDVCLQEKASVKPFQRSY